MSAIPKKTRKPKPRRKKKYGLTLDESVAQQMRVIARGFTRALEKKLAAHNVTSGMWFPLRLLWQEDGQLQHKLQKQLGTAQPTLVSALDRLEKHGLIRRERSETDRRHVHIFLTPAGKRLEKKVLHYADEIQEIALRDVSQAEHRAMMDIFTRIKASLDEELDKTA